MNLGEAAEEEKARLKAEDDARKDDLVKRINDAAEASRAQGLLVDTESGQERRDWRVTDIDTVLRELLQSDEAKSLDHRHSPSLNLKHANLRGCDLSGICLVEANLVGVYFDGSNLTSANLQKARLRGANFLGCTLKGTSIQGADVTGVNFNQSRIYSDTNFVNTILSGAMKFQGVNMDGLTVKYPVFAKGARDRTDRSGGVRAFFRSVFSGLIGEGVDAAEDAVAESLHESGVPESEEAESALGGGMVGALEAKLQGELKRMIGATKVEKFAKQTGQVMRQSKMLDDVWQDGVPARLTKGPRQAEACLVDAAAKLIHAKQKDPALPWFQVFDKATSMEVQARQKIWRHNKDIRALAQDHHEEEKVNGNPGGGFNKEIEEDFFDLSTILRAHAMSESTEYDLEGGIRGNIRSFWKVVTLDPLDLATDLQQLEYLLERVDKLDDPFLPDTWMDIIETWQAVRELCSEMSGSMTQKVLICIFSDTKVMKALALSDVLQPIQDGKAPGGLLTIFKKFLGQHMKKNFYLYQKEIKEEVAHITRIKDLKAQLVAICISGLVALFIGISNFASNYLYGQIFGDDDS